MDEKKIIIALALSILGVAGFRQSYAPEQGNPKLTANKKDLDLSYKFHDKWVLDSLAVYRDFLP